MKKLEIKTTEIEEGGKKLTYTDLVKAILNRAPQGGYSPEEMGARLDILGKFNDKKLRSVKGSKFVDLEDAEFAKLYQCSAAMRWPFMHEDLKTFTDYLESLA